MRLLSGKGKVYLGLLTFLSSIITLYYFVRDITTDKPENRSINLNSIKTVINNHYIGDEDNSNKKQILDELHVSLSQAFPLGYELYDQICTCKEPVVYQIGNASPDSTSYRIYKIGEVYSIEEEWPKSDLENIYFVPDYHYDDIDGVVKMDTNEVLTKSLGVSVYKFYIYLLVKESPIKVDDLLMQSSYH